MHIRQATSKEITGTGLMGYTTPLDRSALVSAFGEPEGIWDLGKTKSEWQLVIAGTVVTIYDYKTIGSTDYRWHIGGHNQSACIVLAAAFRELGVPALVTSE